MNLKGLIKFSFDYTKWVSIWLVGFLVLFLVFLTETSIESCYFISSYFATDEVNILFK